MKRLTGTSGNEMERVQKMQYWLIARMRENIVPECVMVVKKLLT